jgi:hypothetical protein
VLALAVLIRVDPERGTGLVVGRPGCWLRARVLRRTRGSRHLPQPRARLRVPIQVIDKQDQLARLAARSVSGGLGREREDVEHDIHGTDVVGGEGEHVRVGSGHAQWGSRFMMTAAPGGGSWAVHRYPCLLARTRPAVALQANSVSSMKSALRNAVTTAVAGAAHRELFRGVLQVNGPLDLVVPVDQRVDDQFPDRTAWVVIELKLHASSRIDGMNRTSYLHCIK